jgi:hypothetical protein
MHPVHTLQHYFLKIHSDIFSATPRFSAWSLSFRFSLQDIVRIYHISHACYMPHPSHSPWFDQSNYIWWSVQVLKLLIMQSSSASHHFLPPMSKYFPQHPVLTHPRSMIFRYLGIKLHEDYTDTGITGFETWDRFLWFAWFLSIVQSRPFPFCTECVLIFDPFHSEFYLAKVIYSLCGSRDSSVVYGLDDRAFESHQGLGIFLFHHHVRTDSGAHPASYPMGIRGSFPGIKRARREADHSPLSRAEFKECVELYLHFPTSRRVSQLKKMSMEMKTYE